MLPTNSSFGASLPIENEHFTINLNIEEHAINVPANLNAENGNFVTNSEAILSPNQADFQHFQIPQKTLPHFNSDHQTITFESVYETPPQPPVNPEQTFVNSQIFANPVEVNESSIPEKEKDVTSDPDINESSLLGLSVKDLNKKLQGMPKSEVVKVKQKRRTLKNRGYAQNCRQKKQIQKKDLECSVSVLQSKIQALRQELKSVSAERDEYKRKLQFYGDIN